MNVFWLYGVIEGDGEGAVADSITPKMVRDELTRADRSKRLLVRVNSPGGSVFAAVAIRQIFAEWPAGVDVWVDGLAASAASFIATVGKVVSMAEGSMLMVHDAWGLAIGNSAAMHEAGDTLDKVSQSLVGAYVKKSGKSAAEVRAAMRAETWFSAEGAIEFGLADAILSDDGVPMLSARAQRSPAALQQRLDALLVGAAP